VRGRGSDSAFEESRDPAPDREKDQT
jgi:hypothetical protein